jgi:hypothetical protein
MAIGLFLVARLTGALALVAAPGTQVNLQPRGQHAPAIPFVV